MCWRGIGFCWNGWGGCEEWEGGREGVGIFLELEVLDKIFLKVFKFGGMM